MACAQFIITFSSSDDPSSASDESSVSSEVSSDESSTSEESSSATSEESSTSDESSNESDCIHIYHYTDDVLTGFPSEVLDELKHLIVEYSQGASAEYIGIASGDDSASAMKSRVDDYKKDLGINEMRLLYESSSHKHVKEIETELIQFSQLVNSQINRNQVAGGGGRVPCNPIGITTCTQPIGVTLRGLVSSNSELVW